MKQQNRLLKPTGPGEDRDLIEGEACFELLKKRKVQTGLVKRYGALLDADFAGNKIVVCAY